ncbi:sialidase family protein [Myxococcaceae bacterium GXIMD 01537]
MPEQQWEKLGELSNGLRIGAVAASREGFGIIGTTVEPPEGTLPERMRARRAQLHRVTAAGAAQMHEGPGWIQALDCHGSLCVAIGATLRPAGTGTDYDLRVSEDGGRTWQLRGPVEAQSVGQVLAVSPQEVWVLGFFFLGRTLDGGATWAEVSLPGERNPAQERLRRADGGVALVGRGLSLTPDGGATWAREEMGGARVYDVDGPFEVTAVAGAVRVGERQGEDVRLLGDLPPGREPLRLASAEGELRVLSRSADPGRGVEPVLHASMDAGASWSQRPLPVGPWVDVAGRHGLGVDAQGAILGHLAPPSVEEPPAHQPE